MIEEVLCFRVKVIDVDRPAVYGNGDTDLLFFIALTAQRQEAQIIVLRELKQRATQGSERRCLIVFPPKSTQDPAKSRKQYGDTEAGTRDVLGQTAIEMRLPHTAGELKPVARLECVLDVGRDKGSGRAQGLIDGRITAIIEEHIECLVVVLAKTGNADLYVVLTYV